MKNLIHWKRQYNSLVGPIQGFKCSLLDSYIKRQETTALIKEQKEVQAEANLPVQEEVLQMKTWITILVHHIWLKPLT